MNKIKKIAVVNLWQSGVAAELECIARIRYAANMLGIEVIEIDACGYTLDSLHSQISFKDTDFVLHLHYDTPKAYDCFSYGALWNPVGFFHRWGYQKLSSNLLSHDGFLSAGSASVDAMVHRSRGVEFRGVQFPPLNPSLSHPILEPCLRSDRRLFYCGFNWESLVNGHGRFSSLLRTLDAQDSIDIYGPETLAHISPWKGFKCYRGALPFDGHSLVRAAAQAGVVLVLSSAEHKHSKVMSSRLFEAIASGSVIIADRHPFILEHLKDAVLLLDDSVSEAQQSQQITHYLDWINAHPQQAFDLAQAAQTQLTDKWLLHEQLERICNDHARNISVPAPHAPETKGGLSFLYIPLTSDLHHLSNSFASLAQQSEQDFEILCPIVQEIDWLQVIHVAGIDPARVRVIDAGIFLNTPFAELASCIGRLIQQSSKRFAHITFSNEIFFHDFVSCALQPIPAAGMLPHQMQAWHIPFVIVSDDSTTSVQRPVLGQSIHQPRLLNLMGMVFSVEDYRQHCALLDFLSTAAWLTAFPMLTHAHRCFVPKFTVQDNEIHILRGYLTKYEASTCTQDDLDLIEQYEHAVHPMLCHDQTMDSRSIYALLSQAKHVASHAKIPLYRKVRQSAKLRQMMMPALKFWRTLFNVQR